MVIKHWPFVLVLITGLSLTTNLWQLYREFHRQNFVELENVHVLERLDDYRFKMNVEDPDDHRRHVFSIRFCPDFKPTHEIVPGTVLTLLKYETYTGDSCVGIGKDRLGYTLLRDQQLNPILLKESER